ncbi:uncharacterized protein LOC128169456 [Crassostrea angulata]|uniref:uncharacterized protein LOC128169456 n=1 Tax=Magallana angulata TaxID=2784310 RepID=UPI0022B1FE37|nr:uncharacterized protein LOC128169456 [Crassostrea angulata]
MAIWFQQLIENKTSVEQIENERRTREPPNAPVRNPREIISISDDSIFEELVKFMNWSSMYEDESASGPGPVQEGANKIVEESYQESKHVSSCMEVTSTQPKEN